MTDMSSINLYLEATMCMGLIRIYFSFQASEKQVLIALWALICVNCVFATILAITYTSIYELL